MSNYRLALKELLTDDAALASLLPGGFIDADDFDQDGGGINIIPTEDDGIRIKSFAVIRWRASVPIGPIGINAEQQTVEIYVYQQRGYDKITAGIDRIKIVLDRTFFDSVDRALVRSHLIFTSGEIPDTSLSNLPCQFVRFLVTFVR